MRSVVLALFAAPVLSFAQAPSEAVRTQVLQAVVNVRASDCKDGKMRIGSGFMLEQAGRIVTAHHVVGGCSTIQVRYEGVPSDQRRIFEARIVRVHAASDLSLLEVAAPPSVRTLRLSSAAVSGNVTYAGFGYPLGVPTASDQPVTLAVGATRLRDVLPDEAAQELTRSGSLIATGTQVLRLNIALQPGMSGGPIVDAAGDVIGVVAGGLKSGASTVSWAWPSDGVRRLLASTEPVGQAVILSKLQYTLPELEQLAAAQRSGRRLTCGELTFYDSGERRLVELLAGADDYQRVEHIMRISQETAQELGQARFRVWSDAATGATAVVPSGYALSKDGNVCVARSTRGPFQLLVWGAETPKQTDVQWRSQEFEQRIIGPRMPYMYGAQIDPQLTTFMTLPNGQWVPGPQVRPNGLMFNRKGFGLPKQPMPFPGAHVPMAHGFHTLVAQSGNFLGVAALNDEVDPSLGQCIAAGFPRNPCARSQEHLREWTRFILATQLSTFPAL